MAKKSHRIPRRFTLNIWNDRNSVVHGTQINHSKLELIVHVHKLVQQEYARHARENDSFMSEHFSTKLTDRLKDSLKAMRFWLKRVEASRVRQSLLREANEKIRQIQAENSFVNVEEILTKNNRDLKKWITSKFPPTEESQTTIDRFFRP